MRDTLLMVAAVLVLLGGPLLAVAVAPWRRDTAAERARRRGHTRALDEFRAGRREG